MKISIELVIDWSRFVGVERDLRVARVGSLTARQPNATRSFSF